jgi:hypothetical protein
VSYSFSSPPASANSDTDFIEGLLTFHSLPSLAPLPLSAFPSVKGVVAFSLDEDEVAGGGARDAVHICVVKRRTVYILRVTKNEVTIVGVSGIICFNLSPN